MIVNLLLFCMCICYCIPIIYVYSSYDSNTSLSHIICNENITNVILYSTLVMSIFTIQYELLRNNIYSLASIIGLFIGIIGLLQYNTTTYLHYVFASIAFVSILGFMMIHCCTIDNRILHSIASIQIYLVLWIMITIREDIFYNEVLFLLLFALFYFYLHILQ
jgi:hypothetical protein